MENKRTRAYKTKYSLSLKYFRYRMDKVFEYTTNNDVMNSNSLKIQLNNYVIETIEIHNKTFEFSMNYTIK